MPRISHSLKKLAKTVLLKFLAYRMLPDVLTRYLLNVLGIGFEKVAKCGQAAFVARYISGCRGCFCVSVDFDNRDEHRREISTKATVELVSLCEEFDIPITWAICGITAVNESEAFNRIVNSKVKHELAIHTYDHVDFSDPSCDERLARSQVTRTIQLLPPSRGPLTFVFPWNRYGHFNLLRDEGFIAYRGNSRKLGFPSKMSGLWNIYPLVYISEKSYTHSVVLKAFLDLAMSYRSVFHLWFHPWNLEVGGDVSKYISETLRPLFKRAQSERRKGRLWVCTLSELANYCEARSICTLTHFRPNNRSIVIYVKSEIPDDRFNKKQCLTLGVKIPKNDGFPKFSLDEQSVDERDAIVGEECCGWRITYVNVFIDKPQKRLQVDLQTDIKNRE